MSPWRGGRPSGKLLSMATRTKGWSDLTSAQRRGIIVVGGATSIWQLAMLYDLWRRPDDQIRGSKRRWVLASFARPVGQIAYYAWGRHPKPDASD
jgi:hypothetical protein